jgi:hypothetical protein
LLYEDYVAMLADAAGAAIPDHPVVVCCERRATSRLRTRRATHPRVCIDYFSHDEYIRLVASARLVLTTPGVTSTLEALTLRRRVRFLLPLTYAQALHAGHYRQVVGRSSCMSFDDFGGDFAVENGLSEAVGLLTIASHLRAVVRDRTETVCDMVHAMLTGDGASSALAAMRPGVAGDYDSPGQVSIVSRVLEDAEGRSV